MNKTCFLAAVVVVFLVQSAAFSQTPDLPKFEVAAEFSTFEREEALGFSEGRKTDPGLGGRFTYNLNRVVSFEGAAYFFFKDCFDCIDPGHIKLVLGGVKAGKRFERWGIFAKARPGVFHHNAHFGGPITCLNILCPFTTEPFEPGKKHFAADIGGVVEFYPSKRIVTRFDAGDTMIHYRRNVTAGLVRSPGGGFDPFPFIIPARTSHNFQFITSIGFRF